MKGVYVFLKRVLNIVLVTLIYLSFIIKPIDTETLQITTYYPAPYGAYVSILTTNNTWLARDGGNVGIGTTAPGEKLHVVGSVRIEGWDAVLHSVDTARRYQDLIGTYQGWNPNTVYIAGYNAVNSAARNTTAVSIGGSGSERLWVDLMTGNVGIGTTNPQYKLDVDGDLRVTGIIRDFCIPVAYPNGTCPWTHPRMSGFFPNYSGYIDFYATDAWSLQVTRYRFSLFSGGTMICCKIWY